MYGPPWGLLGRGLPGAADVGSTLDKGGGGVTQSI